MRASNVTMGSVDICVKRVGGGRGEGELIKATFRDSSFASLQSQIAATFFIAPLLIERQLALIPLEKEKSYSTRNLSDDERNPAMRMTMLVMMRTTMMMITTDIQCQPSRQWQFANGSELKASSADIGRYSLLLSVMSQGATVLYFVTIRFVFCILYFVMSPGRCADFALVFWTLYHYQFCISKLAFCGSTLYRKIHRCTLYNVCL